MRTLKYLLLLILAPICFAQTTQTVPIPPCTLNFTLSNTNLTSQTFANSTPSCDKWTVTAYVVGSGTFTLTLQSAPPATTSTPGSWITYPGTTATGSNPLTATGIATFTNGTTATQFMRLLLNVSSGSATVYGVLQGSQTVVSKGGGGGGGGGGPTIAGTANEIAVAGAGCTTPSTATCTISVPNNPILPGVVTASGFSANENVSGSVSLSGFTSGNSVWAVADVAGTAIVYVYPASGAGSGKFLQDTGSTTCPTLPAGYPTVCHQLAWATGGGGGYATIQNGGSSLPAETVLNFVLGGCVDNPAISTDCTIGAGSGGPVVGYSAAAITLPAAGTTFLPPAGGGLASTTEATVQASAPTASPISNMYVTLGTPIGTGNSIAITFRDAGASKTLTCTISGSSALKCNDIVHSFTPVVGDALDIQIVTTGIVAVAPNIQILYEYGSSGGGGGGGVSYHYQYYPAGVGVTQTGYAATGTFSSGNSLTLPTGGSTGSFAALGLTEFRSSGDDGIILTQLPSTWDGSALLVNIDGIFPDGNTGNATFQAYSACIPVNALYNPPASWTASGTNVPIAAPGTGNEVGRWALSVPVTSCVAGNFVYIDIRRPSTDSYTSTIFTLGISVGIKY